MTPSVYGGTGPFPGALNVVDLAETPVGIDQIAEWLQRK